MCHTRITSMAQSQEFKIICCDLLDILMILNRAIDLDVPSLMHTQTFLELPLTSMCLQQNLLIT